MAIQSMFLRSRLNTGLNLRYVALYHPPYVQMPIMMMIVMLLFLISVTTNPQMKHMPQQQHHPLALLERMVIEHTTTLCRPTKPEQPL